MDALTLRRHRFAVDGYVASLVLLYTEVYENILGQLHIRWFFKRSPVHIYLMPSSCHLGNVVKHIRMGVPIRIDSNL